MGLRRRRVPSPILSQCSLNAVRLSRVEADCAHVFIDGSECGWCWGPDWLIRPAFPISAGEHAIEVRLIPSTFNFYGPSHHIDGDIPVVSPIQYEYRKNFADRPDAPLDTGTPEWHFKPFGIANVIEISED
jgi:hypothetical protein